MIINVNRRQSDAKKFNSKPLEVWLKNLVIIIVLLLTLWVWGWEEGHERDGWTVL